MPYPATKVKPIISHSISNSLFQFETLSQTDLFRIIYLASPFEFFLKIFWRFYPTSTMGWWHSSQPDITDTQNKGPVHAQTIVYPLKLTSTTPPSWLTRDSTTETLIILPLRPNMSNSLTVSWYLAMQLHLWPARASRLVPDSLDS